MMLIPVLVLIWFTAACMQAHAYTASYHMRHKRESIREAVKLVCLRRPDLAYCQQHGNHPKPEIRHAAPASKPDFKSSNRGILDFSVPEVGRLGVEQLSSSHAGLDNAYDSGIMSPGEALQKMALEPMALARQLSVTVSPPVSQNVLSLKSPRLEPLFKAIHGTRTETNVENDDNDLLSSIPETGETSTTRPKHPFDQLQERPDLHVKPYHITNKTSASEIVGKIHQVIPARSTAQEGFLEQDGIISTLAPPPPPPSPPPDPSSSLTDHPELQETAYGLRPGSGTGVGFTIEDMFQLCQRFLPVAAQHCTNETIEARFVKRCRGYLADCAPFLVSGIGQQKPESVLKTIADAYNSGIGLTYYHWGVNGIPFYPINEEGSISNGANGKVDYGSWGAGFSNNFGVRDYWTMNSEAGANWYEGLYGYRNGWHVPIVRSLGIEGGGGSQVHVPIKEGDFGKPLHSTTGYFVGPYAGVAESTGLDWLNGRVTTQSGFASPYVGVNVNSGSSIGFPSIASIMRQLASNPNVLHFSADSVSRQQFAAPTIYDLMRMFSN